MSSFNKYERKLAILLSKFPVLKKTIKRIYSFISYLRYKKDYAYTSDFPLVEHGATKDTFFGYYDKSPLSPRGDYLLLQESNSTRGRPADSHAMLLCMDKKNNKVFSSSLQAFNWQQGGKLQWLSDTSFIFNDYDDNRKSYISKLIDVTVGNKTSTLPLPVYDCFNDEYALCLNYERLTQFAPDYGYFAKPVQELPSLEEDGIWKMCLKSGVHSLLVTLQNVANLKSDGYSPQLPNDMNHTVNHIMISPSGEGFIFIHRYYLSGQRLDRLIYCDLKGRMSVIADNNMVSHCFWVDDDTVLGYLRGPKNVDGYWLIGIEANEFKPFAHNKLAAFGDGHPHVNGDWFVTDTYPDKARMQHLLLCNLKTEEVRELGEFFHGFKFDGETRCDLHPRFSFDGNSIFFDSVYSGKRCLYQMDLDL